VVVACNPARRVAVAAQVDLDPGHLQRPGPDARQPLAPGADDLTALRDAADQIGQPAGIGVDPGSVEYRPERVVGVDEPAVELGEGHPEGGPFEERSELAVAVQCASGRAHRHLP
jgi:hypothetical protein